jgi:hypothetical protein
MTDDPFLPPDDEEDPTLPAPERAGERRMDAAPLEPPFPESAAPEEPRAQPEPPAPLSPQSRPPQGKRREERPATRGPRPDLSVSAEPLYRDSAGYRMRLEPADLARLRELPGSKGKTDQELGETFFDGQAARFSASLSEDVPTPAEVRVVVDPYSRQAFLAVEKKIRSIVSF